jgi:hypothetical protein
MRADDFINQVELAALMRDLQLVQLNLLDISNVARQLKDQEHTLLVQIHELNKLVGLELPPNLGIWAWQSTTSTRGSTS